MFNAVLTVYLLVDTCTVCLKKLDPYRNEYKFKLSNQKYVFDTIFSAWQIDIYCENFVHICCTFKEIHYFLTRTVVLHKIC